MSVMDIALAGYLAFGQLIPSGQQEIVKHAGLQVIHADGAVTLRLREEGRETRKERGGKTTTIRLKDEHYPFEVTRFVKSWDDCGVVETWVEIVHSEPGPVKLVAADSFASDIASGESTVKVLSLSGTWAFEANVRDSAVAPGQAVQLLSRSGTRDAWESNAAMMVEFGEDVDEDRGKVFGVALAWTGTTNRRVRRDWDGKTTGVFAGIDMTTGPYTLDPGIVFTTPKAVLVWSEKGRGEVSRQYHRWARNHLMPHGRELRPVLLNSWEGSRFGFSEQTLLDMMDGVGEMGGEMFVLDDGWFGRGMYARKDETAGLGDWTVNGEKLPHGLGWLAEEAGRRGLKFGLWVEPEMVNEKSRLAEAHPEWILREEHRPLALGRGGTQAVLDYANPAVRDNIYDQIDTLSSSIPSLAYVKWDCNQNIVNPGSPYLPADRQPNLWYDYTVGLYDLLAKFRAKRPNVIVQACASGGGHMDFGFLEYADEFWTSDNTDPYQRVFIQWGASQFYPACAMACHVTASPNHQTKRETPLKYRFDVAMCGRMGFELHPRDLTDEELAFAKKAVVDYKRIRPIVQQGDLYRLASPYEKPLSALMYVNSGDPVNPVKEAPAAVLFALGLKIDGERTETLKLRGLDPDATYSICEINCGERLHVPGGLQPSAAASGRELMARGVGVRLAGAYDSVVIEIIRRTEEGK